MNKTGMAVVVMMVFVWKAGRGREGGRLERIINPRLAKTLCPLPSCSLNRRDFWRRSEPHKENMGCDGGGGGGGDAVYGRLEEGGGGGGDIVEDL
jgi:hypothetical protein